MATFVSIKGGITYVLAYYAGLMPYMKFNEASFASPWLTKDYYNMKMRDAREKSWLFYPYIALIWFGNKVCDPMTRHLNKRGVITSYWVINDEIEVKQVYEGTSC